MNPSDPTRNVDVAIIGLGPTGAVLANMLGKAGVNTVVFDREPGPIDLPRAVHLDGEVMRVFQAIDLGEEAAGVVGRSNGVRYYSADGELLMQRRPPGTVGKHQWADKNMFHQPDLEAALRAGIERYPSVDVRLSHDVVQIMDTGAEVVLEVQADGAAETETWHAKWVVGSDGGRSSVRQAMETKLEDLGVHDPWLVVDIELTSDVDLPDCTVQYCNPDRPTTYVHVTGNRRRWEFKIMPGDDLDRLTDPDNIWQLVSRWVTPEQAKLTRSAIYTFHALLAENWRVGRLLLAGDSAHQTPPFLGQGMCTGVRDSSNLGWKLAAVAAGADDALLDTYGSERSPHARVFLETAAYLGSIIQTTDPAVAAERNAQMLEGGATQFVDPTPPLGEGVHAGPEAAGGTIAPQPLLNDGSKLDDTVGNRFAVVTSPALPEADVREARATAERIGVSWVSDAALDEWLAAQGARAVVLRPDRYLVGAAQDPASLLTLLDLVDRAVTPDSTRVPA